mmetsp:Transcript_17704/g.51527  ORF Transcript_17704/g.51527 Transcript_17704/m.51527 type:complete len:160 (-) Transcript_17704:474-953(-)
MMSNSWGFEGLVHSPSLLGAHTKLRLGWLKPTRVAQSGVYTIHVSHSSLDALCMDYGFLLKNEYLLIDNQLPKPFNSKIPGADKYGVILAVWYIDESVGWNIFDGILWTVNVSNVPWPRNGKWYNMNILQADGNFDIERQRNQDHADNLWRGDDLTALQ